jgi:hypothetical protein
MRSIADIIRVLAALILGSVLMRFIFCAVSLRAVTSPVGAATALAIGAIGYGILRARRWLDGFAILAALLPLGLFVMHIAIKYFVLTVGDAAALVLLTTWLALLVVLTCQSTDHRTAFRLRIEMSWTKLLFCYLTGALALCEFKSAMSILVLFYWQEKAITGLINEPLLWLGLAVFWFLVVVVTIGVILSRKVHSYARYAYWMCASIYLVPAAYMTVSAYDANTRSISLFCAVLILCLLFTTGCVFSAERSRDKC